MKNRLEKRNLFAWYSFLYVSYKTRTLKYEQVQVYRSVIVRWCRISVELRITTDGYLYTYLYVWKCEHSSRFGSDAIYVTAYLSSGGNNPERVVVSTTYLIQGQCAHVIHFSSTDKAHAKCTTLSLFDFAAIWQDTSVTDRWVWHKFQSSDIFPPCSKEIPTFLIQQFSFERI